MDLHYEADEEMRQNDRVYSVGYAGPTLRILIKCNGTFFLTLWTGKNKYFEHCKQPTYRIPMSKTLMYLSSHSVVFSFNMQNTTATFKKDYSMSDRRSGTNSFSVQMVEFVSVHIYGISKAEHF